jgi:hypothetical protein
MSRLSRVDLRTIHMFGLAIVGLLIAAFATLRAYADPTTATVEEAGVQTAAEQKREKTRFLRVTRDDDNELVAMETAIVRYAPAKEDDSDLVVDLVAAVHVGEGEYFAALNDAFKDYDAVLYELVAPEEAPKPAPGKRSAHPIAMLQGGMQNMLELKHQLDGVDYERKNFVHADMSPEDFERSMSDRGENFFSMFFRMLGHSIAQQSLAAQRNPGARQSDAGMLLALMNADRAMSMRRLMAEQFENMDGMVGGLDGPQGSTLISERNKVAIDVLKREMAAGKKRLAIFYGAGHMRDMERRLTDELGLKLESERWLVAWKLQRDKSEQAEDKEN